ncbi:hypothetical protein [Rhabdaerophilum sp. SD176]|uniref:hypothetical protein n=1 Tax=Rhabdaerophilum sp. SD176 TaxID=2983548 RepID=UPI0024E01930|nr:hypothetical protein [Rhabdaerophilum sp. SD176]
MLKRFFCIGSLDLEVRDTLVDRGLPGLTLGRNHFEDRQHSVGLKQLIGKCVSHERFSFRPGNCDALADKLTLFRRIEAFVISVERPPPRGAGRGRHGPITQATPDYAAEQARRAVEARRAPGWFAGLQEFLHTIVGLTVNDGRDCNMDKLVIRFE